MDVARAVGALLGIENKFLDTELTTTALDATWGAQNPTGGSTGTLSVPAEGDGESERIGRTYTIDSLFIHGLFRVASIESAVAPISDARARIVVYWDKQTNSATATAADIMDLGGADDILAFRNLQNSKRFTLLLDKTVCFRFGNQTNEGAINLFASGKRLIPFTLYKKFPRGLQVNTDAAAANVTSATDNNFGVIAITEAASAAVFPSLSYTARLRFRG